MKNIYKGGILAVIILLMVQCSGAKKLEKALANPIGVTKLKIKNADLGILPPDIGKLTDLKTLYLYRDGIDKIPDEIGNLINLETLVLSTNHLTELPASIGKLTSLRELDLAYCGALVQIPESIRNCHNLEYLYIDNSLLLPFSINSVNPRLQIVVKQVSGSQY